MKEYTNDSLFIEAQKYIPGGVNSPVRAFQSVGINPLFIQRAKGSHIWDVEGKSYIDYVQSWGALILGHADAHIIEKVTQACHNGTSFGAPTHAELELAKLINQSMPSIEMLRMVNSGTEATMSAIRLARAYTNRDKIIKFEGCYHGHADSFLIQAGSGALTTGVPSSKGVTFSIAQDTLLAQFNHIDSVKTLLKEYKNKIAALIIEPICGNVGCIPPQKGFLQELRELCTNENIVLIFDEVITGFRVSLGGAQELYNVYPDLTCLGKIIGGGFPVGAFGGKKDIMCHLSPLGEVYQAGTLSGNPIAMTAGIHALKRLQDGQVYKALEEHSGILESGIHDICKRYAFEYTYNRVASMFSVFFGVENVDDVQLAKASDLSMFSKYFQRMLVEGVYLAPSQFECSFLSYAHTKDDCYKTLELFEKCINELKKESF